MGRSSALNISREGPRSCGPCTLCCKVLAIPEVPTPRNEWCSHARKGAGCDCYAERPTMCREFRCMWLDGHLPVWARPDKIHGVVFATSPTVMQITEDPGYPGDASRALAPLWGDWFAHGHYVAILCGERWRIQARPDLLKDIGRVALKDISGVESLESVDPAIEVKS